MLHAGPASFRSAVSPLLVFATFDAMYPGQLSRPDVDCRSVIRTEAEVADASETNSKKFLIAQLHQNNNFLHQQPGSSRYILEADENASDIWRPCDSPMSPPPHLQQAVRTSWRPFWVPSMVWRDGTNGNLQRTHQMDHIPLDTLTGMLTISKYSANRPLAVCNSDRDATWFCVDHDVCMSR